MNVVRLVHEAATQRQHVRIRMPATVSIGGADYPAFDWSVGGFSITDANAAWRPEQQMQALMHFDFDGFRFTLDVLTQMRWLDSDRRKAGFQFLNPTDNDLSLLQFLVGSYLSGEVVQSGDLIAIVRRDSTTKPRGGAKGGAEELKGFAWFKSNVKRISLLAGLWLAVACVFFMIATSAYNRLFLVKGLAAVISPDAAVVSAPRTGLILPFKVDRGQHVVPRQTLLKMELGEDKTATVISGCDCYVAEQLAKPGTFVQKGSSLMTLAPVKGRLAVQVHIALEDTSRVKVGDDATIFLLGDRRTVRGHVERIEAPTVGPASSTLMVGERLQAIVTVRLDHKLPVAAVGQAATATIQTINLFK